LSEPGHDLPLGTGAVPQTPLTQVTVRHGLLLAAQQVKAVELPGFVRQAIPLVLWQAHGPCLCAIHCV
jgi:hypothetical protein